MSLPAFLGYPLAVHDRTIFAARMLPAFLGLAALTACVPAAPPKPLPMASTGEILAVSGSVAASGASSASAPAKAPGEGGIRTALTASGFLSMGRTGAPLTLTVITNHGCGYCRQFQEELFPRLKKDFIDTGYLRYEVALLPLRKYTESDLFARATLCAERQKKGFAVHGSLFGAARKDRAFLTELAKQSGMDAAAFGTCLDDPATAGLLEAQRRTLTGTTLVPTFLLNGRAEAGLPEYPELRGRIEQAIREGNIDISHGKPDDEDRR